MPGDILARAEMRQCHAERRWPARGTLICDEQRAHARRML